ncbi:MAG TPA: radical SAM family heme chaperone HemW [Polyangia bacterium]|jgi:oxygen-independent coproporphyrinogen-3 oxidase|nr:radical SAM family heme chaperone HemW [Polyangia bacterium]
MLEVSVGTLAPGLPLGVYVHFPYCGVHCPYCDFAVEVAAEIPHDEYADLVVAEIAARRDWFAGTAGLVSIYFGGGTPGLWRPDALGRVLQAARAAFDAPDAGALEITVEANPGELDAARLQALRAAGVNRLSLGAQATEDRLLRTLGRNHDSGAVGAAMCLARAAGFDNISIDLMFGVPGQTLDDWKRSVEVGVALGPEHVSAYALTIERGTPFGALDRAGRLPRPDDEVVAEMFTWARAAFEAAGLPPYEVSSYARPGRRARHNSLYWSGAPYLGVGASASSFRPLLDGTGWRFANPRATATYRAAAGADGGSPRPVHVERRAPADLENEALWLGLRTSDGVDRAAHRARHGRDPLSGREDAARKIVAAGWLTVAPGHLRLTPSGLLFADEVATRLWLDAADAGPRVG